MSSELDLITCVVQRGEADKTVEAAVSSGAQGATIFYARGTGVRQKLGFFEKFIDAEKEVILIVTKRDQTQKVFDSVVDVAQLRQPGRGFAFVHVVDQAVGFLEQTES